MAKQSLHPVLHKSICQIRFKPKLQFHSAIFSKLGTIEEDYGDGQTDGATTLLINYERRYSLMLRTDVVQFEQDSSDSETESKGIGHVLAVTKEYFGLDSLERIALRRSYLLPIGDGMNFASLVALLNVKLLSQERALRQCVPGTVKDLAYRVDMWEGQRQYNVIAGALKREEVPRFLPFNANVHLKPETRAQEHGHVLDSYPALSLFTDVDYFQSEPKPSADEAEAFILSARTRIHETTHTLAKYLLSEKGDV